MFFSKSALILEIKNSDLTFMKNFSFFENNGEKEYSKKFYSITFEDENLTIGEINYTNSFEYGNMNTINFIRKNNLFFLFTSSVQHTKFLKKIFNKMSIDILEFNILRLPITDSKISLSQIQDLKVIDNNDFPGIAGILFHNDNRFLIKIYYNGLITYPFTNDKNIIDIVITTYLEVLKEYDLY